MVGVAVGLLGGVAVGVAGQCLVVEVGVEWVWLMEEWAGQCQDAS